MSDKNPAPGDRTILHTKTPLPSEPGLAISGDHLLRGYSQKEFAEVTGYCPRMLSRMKGAGHPAYKEGKWHVYPWLLWLEGKLPMKKKPGRKRLLTIAK